MPGIYFPTAPTDPRPAVAVVINVGKVSSVIAMYDMQKYMIFQGGTKAPDKRLWKLLLAVSEILEFFYLKQTGSAYTEVIANYLWALLTPYQIAALRALSGGGIVINPATGAPTAIQRYDEEFEIGGVDLPEARYGLADGDTVYTVPLSGFIIAQIEPSGVNAFQNDATQASAKVTYNASFITFTFNQPVRTGEKYIVWGLRGGNITSIPTGGTQLPIPYQQGKFLTNDGTNLLWDDVWIPITAADFEDDGRTYINTSLNGYYLGVNWINNSSWIDFEAGDATLIDGGGFIVNIADFDATQNPDWSFKVFKKSLP